MKVKLLKKVRKRYSIVMIDKLPKANIFTKRDDIRYSNTVPFFEVIDKKSPFICTDRFHTTLESAIDAVVEMIQYDYGHKFVKEIRSTKVWYK